MTKLRLLDLFSGIGGFSLGLERSGAFQTVAFCEIEPFARAVLRKHWPETPIYDDVRMLTAGGLATDGIRVDAICGGFPCQDISYAGRGAGLSGQRSGLWFEFARLIGELGPRIVIVENVAALLTRGLPEVLGTLAAIGYDAEWHCIPASAVGAPHRRDRIWILAYPCGQGLQGLVRNDCFLSSTPTPHPEHFDTLLGAWRSLDMDSASIRKSDGLPRVAHRIKAIGNAVVPQIPEIIGRAILGAT